jgi:acyl-CoA dehydrogenase
MNFRIPADVADIAARTRAFVEEVAIPMEPDGFDDLGVKESARAALLAQARARGLPCPQASPELGGLGVDMRGRAVIYEEAGRSLLGPQGLNCAAPDEGNMHLLERVASEEQIERFLAPLVAGDIRSCFAMTEPPPGAGSDPSMLQSTATRIDGGWRLDGHKWFITGAVGAGFAIYMARTGERIDKHGGATMFLVDLDSPGVEIVRPISTYDAAAVGGHAEMRFNGVQVGDEAVLGQVDQGYRYAQVRLAPARLTHCMRWLGLAQRAHEMTIARVGGREAFGQPLGTLGMAQQMLADNEIDLRAARLLTWQACDVLDHGGDARQESSVAKTFVAEAVHRVVDRSVQLHGAVGVSGETILSRFLQEVRPFRIYDGPSEVHRWAIARRLLHSGGAPRPITELQEQA